MRTQQEGGRLHIEERGLQRNHPCPHLDLRLPASRTERNKWVLFNPPPASPSAVLCYSSTGWLRPLGIGGASSYSNLTGQLAQTSLQASCKTSHEKGKGGFSRGPPNQRVMAAPGASIRSGGRGSLEGAGATLHPPPPPNQEWPGSHGLCNRECVHWRNWNSLRLNHHPGMTNTEQRNPSLSQQPWLFIMRHPRHTSHKLLQNIPVALNFSPSPHLSREVTVVKINEQKPIHVL